MFFQRWFYHLICLLLTTLFLCKAQCKCNKKCKFSIFLAPNIFNIDCNYLSIFKHILIIYCIHSNQLTTTISKTVNNDWPENRRTTLRQKLTPSLNFCLAQIRFVINVPEQVTKPKGYVATLITLILIIRSWTERDLFLRVRSTFHCLA